MKILLNPEVGFHVQKLLMFFLQEIFDDLIEAAFMICLSHHGYNSICVWEIVTFFLAVKLV